MIMCIAFFLHPPANPVLLALGGSNHHSGMGTFRDISFHTLWVSHIWYILDKGGATSGNIVLFYSTMPYSPLIIRRQHSETSGRVSGSNSAHIVDIKVILFRYFSTFSKQMFLWRFQKPPFISFLAPYARHFVPSPNSLISSGAVIRDQVRQLVDFIFSHFLVVFRDNNPYDLSLHFIVLWVHEGELVDSYLDEFHDVIIHVLFEL